jgi:3-oxoadipate enol-lactonase/4-carboxymuconolactone decarboxylase
MAFAQLADIRCYYRLEGAADRPVLVLSHSLGLDHTMWDPQMAALTARCRVLRYDHRGHGASDAPAGDYTIEQLGRDALALLDRLGLDRVAWCGFSMGGMVGQWLAAHAGDRLTSLVLANTPPRTADPTGMEARRQTALDRGMAAIVDTTMPRFFAAPLLAANPPSVASTRETLLACNPVGYAGACAAVRDFDAGPLLERMATPSVVISSDGEDTLSNVALPRTFARALLDVIAADPRDPFDAGLQVRRAVLGAAYVDQRMAAATDLTRGFQQLITRYVWGSVWTRPGLETHTRRLLVLAITAALGRWEEFRLHLRAGLDADLEWAEVEEVLLQTAVYAGVPAANTAFSIAAELRGPSPAAPHTTDGL